MLWDEILARPTLRTYATEGLQELLFDVEGYKAELQGAGKITEFSTGTFSREFMGRCLKPGERTISSGR